MIVPSIQSDAPPPHPIEQVLLDEMEAHPSAAPVLTEVWESVQAFLQERPHPHWRKDETMALLYARALSAVHLADVASRVVGRVPAVANLAGRIDPSRLPLSAISALATGLLRLRQDTALCRGLMVVMDGRRLNRDATWWMDLAVVPALQRLAADAMHVLRMRPETGILLACGWSPPDGHPESIRLRKDAVARIVTDMCSPGAAPPAVLWMD
jgi:hypothetical protein